MSSTDIVLEMIRVFDEFSIPYMIVGSYSSNYYGRPRSTLDADFVVTLGHGDLDRIANALGSSFRIDPQLSFETITMRQKFELVHILSAFKIELFLLTEDPHNQERFRRRVKVDFEGRAAWLPTAEDVIIQKLRWSGAATRGKDIDDVLKVLQVQGRARRLDVDYIRQWTDDHGTRGIFEQLLTKALA